MTFFEIITAAVADIEKHGYDSKERVDGWIYKIMLAAKSSMISEPVLKLSLQKLFTSTYDNFIEKGGYKKVHGDIPAYRLNLIKYKLREELQRRIMSSAQLIVLNRQEMINRTLARFSGWATSVPVGGSKVTDTRDVKANISKALRNLPFEERRVMIDQGHKFVSNLNDIIATDSGAIAGKWRSHYRQPGYDYRKDHKERDGNYYAIRGNWAIKAGLMTKGAGYTDEMTMPGEEVFCRCDYIYIYSLAKLPTNMLTEKGKRKLLNAS